MRKIFSRNVRIWICAGVCTLLCLADIGKYMADTEEWKKPSEKTEDLYARSAVLMDGDSGRILFGKNETEELPMASTTKIMTCILALEQADLRELCAVTERAAAQPQVKLGMKTGEVYRLEDLLYSLMLESHNDTAVCIAEHVSGSVEEFAKQMNQKAKEIGCIRTHFVTPNGLDGEDAGGIHRTTAKDLAGILRYCIAGSGKQEEFLKITGTLEYRFADLSGKRSFYCSNHNALLTGMEGALTGKTGFTGKAGYCYVGAVRRENKTLIVALLACGWPGNRNYKWKDTGTLMTYGFQEYEKRILRLEEIALPKVSVSGGTKERVNLQIGRREENGSLEVLLRRDEKLRVRLLLPSILEAPIEQERAVGMLRIFAEEEVLREYSLFPSQSVSEKTYGYCLKLMINAYFSMDSNFEDFWKSACIFAKDRILL